MLGRPAWLWSLAAGAVGLALSLAAAGMHHTALARSEHQQLERLAERSFDAVEGELQTCGLLVRSVQALFLASDEVTAEEFQSIYDNLRPREQFPSLQAIAYATRVATPASVVYRTELAAPADGNERLVGLDISTQPANLAAAEQARDTDQPVMSAAFTLVQTEGRPRAADGITIRLPVFTPGHPPRDRDERRRRELGSVAVSFQVSRLIEGALPEETRERFDVHIVDITDGGASPIYMPSAPAEHPPGLAGYERFRRDMAFGGRRWRMDAQARPEGNDLVWFPMLTLGIGVLASALFATLAWSIASTRARAVRLAGDLAGRFRQSEERFRALNELLPALVLLARAGDGRLVYANQACRDRFSFHDGAGGGSLPAMLESPELRQRVLALGEGDDPIHNETVLLQVPGQDPFWATLSVSRILLGSEPHLLAVANDVTELRVLSEELSYQATHDSLTDLTNRREFERRIERAIAQLDAGAPPCALLYLDLDQFKLINDTSGHRAGDQLLTQLAALFGGLLPDEAVVARLGGDEFAILVEGTDAARAMALAERVRLEIDGYMFGWEERNYTISASIGVVVMNGPGLSSRVVLAHADTACYMAKERGRNRVHLFSEDDSETSQRRSEMEWAGRIRQALGENRFVLHYQEIASLWPRDPDAGVHMELLVRLRDENGAMVPPGAFIPAAERFGLMPQLDRWVVDTAVARFNRLHPSGRPVGLCAINLSGPTFEDESFADFVLDRLEEYGVPGHAICFEITETAAVSNMKRVVAFMQRLREAGCRFSLDDFGSGMASFGYLKNLPVDFIKIDGSFIRNIESDPVSYSIVRAVTDIGHQLGLKVVAEWVADDRVRELLRGLSVDYAQGFAIHKPEATLYFRS